MAPEAQPQENAESLWQKIHESRKKVFLSDLETESKEYANNPQVLINQKCKGFLSCAPHPVISFDYHRNSKSILLITKEAKLVLWNIEENKKVIEKTVRRDNILKFNQDCSIFATSGNFSSIIFRSYPELLHRGGLSIENDTITSFEFMPHQELITFATKNGKVYLWDIEVEEQISQFDMHDGAEIKSISFNRNLREFRHLQATGDSTGRVIMMDLLTGKKAFDYTSISSNSINCLKFHPGHPSVIATDAKNSMSIIDLRSDNVIFKTQFSEFNKITSFDFSRSGRLLFIGSHNGKLAYLDLLHPIVQNPLQSLQKTVNCVRMSPDSFNFATCGDDGCVRVWE